MSKDNKDKTNKPKKPQKPGKLFKWKFLFLDMCRAISWPGFWLFFRPKYYYEPGAKRKTKKRVLITGNHNTFAGVPLFLMMFVRRRLHCVMASDIAKSRLSKWFFRHVACIELDRTVPFDLKSFKNSIAALNDERAVAIFPEGHVHKDDEILDFKAGFALMALRTGAPILPIYVVQQNSKWRRVRILVGRQINITDICDGKVSDANAKLVTAYVRNKTIELRDSYFALRESKKRGNKLLPVEKPDAEPEQGEGEVEQEITHQDETTRDDAQ